MRRTTYRHLVLGLCLIAGCKKTVDTKGFEKTLDAKVKALGLVPGPISCPSGVEPKTGGVFTCKVEIEKISYDLAVTITSVEGSNVQMDTAWAKGPAVIRKKIAEGVPKVLGEQLGAKVELDCGKEPLLFLTAGKATCKMTSGHTAATLEISFDDKYEVSSWKLDPPLLGRAKLEEILTPSVAEKTTPAIKVDCGPEDVFPRPAEGVLECAISDGTQHARIKVSISPELKVERWETIKSDHPADAPAGDHP